jgi:hypothetical protein
MTGRAWYAVHEGYDKVLLDKPLSKYGFARVTLPNGAWLQVGMNNEGDGFDIRTSGAVSIEPNVTNSMQIKVGK